MKHLLIVVLLIFMLQIHVYGAETEARPDEGTGTNEEVINNRKYERLYLYPVRDEFIKVHGDLPVGGVDIRGLKKTKAGVVASLAGINEGELLSVFDPFLAVNRLKKKNIFSEIDISYYEKDGSAVIQIDVEEKWTLVPIPFFTSNRHGWKFGFFLMETNLFGYAKMLFAGGTVSSFGETGMLGYIDPSIADTKLAANIFLTYADEIYENSDTNNNVYSEYRAARQIARLDFGYSFTDNFKLFASCGYERAEVNTSYNDSRNVPENAEALGAGTVLKYERLRYNEYLYYGPRLELMCLRYFDMTGDYSDYTDTKYKFEYSVRVWNHDRLTLLSSGFYGDNPPVLQERIGGKPGGRTLPADTIIAGSCVNYTLTYEYPFLRFKWGCITLVALWEEGVFENDSTDSSHYYGPGGGMLFYLKRVAFPALGFNVAGNLRTGSTEFSANVGAAF